jgi:periplasmic protein TonB
VIETPSDALFDDLDFTWGDMDIFDDAPPPRPPPTMEDDSEHYFVAVEQMPEIIGGIASVLRNLTYPEISIRAGIEGTVYVLAYVDEEGVVQKVDIARGVGVGLDEAAMEAVSKVRFIPGRQRGVPRKVLVTVPVKFSLRDR